MEAGIGIGIGTRISYNKSSVSSFLFSLDNPGVFVADVTSEVQEDEEEEVVEEAKQGGGGEGEHQKQRAPVKREAAWDYSGNNTGKRKKF